MLATIASAALLGVEGRRVAVEVHASTGLPSFAVVGQPDSACREARDRVRAAIESSGLRWEHRRYVVNLAPSSLRKAGTCLDLAIAVGVLVVTEQLPPAAPQGLAFFGELGLDGRVRRVPGTLALVEAIELPGVVVPTGSVHEAGLVGRHVVHPARDLASVVAALAGRSTWPPAPPAPASAAPVELEDLSEVRGQPVARRAVEVAAAGGHHLLLVGPPGAGKTMLARRLRGLLPDMAPDDSLAATRIHSAAGAALPPAGLLVRPPLRAPHHSASTVALVGGGSSSRLRVGEVSMAHGGILFMDELGEFPPSVLDALRQPLEEGVVRVARADLRVEMPARFQLVAAMNPCPCGMRTSPDSCRCSDLALARYCRRVSGPLLDRFDLRIEVSRPNPAELLSGGEGESSAGVADRVASARRAAMARGASCNAQLGKRALDVCAALDPAAAALLDEELRRGRLSGRGVARVRRVARTIADLEDHAGPVTGDHVAEALLLRANPAFAVERMVG